MSILVKIEMPENCRVCPMANLYNGYGTLQGCRAVQEKEYAAIDEKYDQYERPSWCPLVELPPHGRLIDADACEGYFYEHMSDDMMIAAMNAINEMPTIIESEGENEHTD